MKNIPITLIIVILVIGVGGFFVGMKYQESKTPNFPNRFTQGGQGRRGQFGQRADGQGSRPINGTILSLDDESITVELPDGSSKIILITDSSTINKTDTGTKEDLKEGTQVIVFGKENSDGSISAQNVQINPIRRGFIGRPSIAPN